MKRLFAFVIICLILICVAFCGDKKLSVNDLFENMSAEIYLPTQTQINNFKTIKNGQGQIVFCQVGDIEAFLKLHNINGYTIKVKNSTINRVLKKVMPVAKYTQKNLIYGYSFVFDKSLNINGNKVNFQCAQSGDDVLIGSPILLGSY